MSAPAKTSEALRVLVPTDLSPASRAGLRFAIQWSAQQPAELICVHVLNTLRPTPWTDQQYDEYAALERERCRKQLEHFVSNVYKQAGVERQHCQCVLIEAISADVAITDYCHREKNIDYICMSTRGAGRMKRIFGTHAGNLITHSKIPVLAVPAKYRTREIARVLYAGDLSSYEREIGTVVHFASPLGARVDLLHFTETGEVAMDTAMMKKVFHEQFHYSVNVHFREIDDHASLVKNLEKQIRLFNPSVVVLFTDQHRSLLDKFINPSLSESLAFGLRAPLLVFPKG